MPEPDPRGAGRLALGTVQLGVDYGLSNITGKPAPSEAGVILRAAVAAGIRTFDTAHGYGDSEHVLGEHLADADVQIVTKTPVVDEARPVAEQVAQLRAGVEESRRRLRRPVLDVLLVHHGRQLLGPAGDALADEVRALRAEGVARRIGVSVYEPADLEAVAERFRPDVVQVPANVLDRRFVGDPTLQSLRAGGCEVHVRSVFLQGLLLLEPDQIPESIGDLRPAAARFRDRCAERGVTPLEGALRFGLELDIADRVVVGIATAAQLAEVVGAADGDGTSIDDSRLGVDSPHLDPSTWGSLRISR